MPARLPPPDPAPNLTRRQFVDRVALAGACARAFALELGGPALPERIVFNLREWSDPAGTPPPPGMLKYLGGRFVAPARLHGLSADEAWGLLWVDGKVPRWINVAVGGLDAEVTEVEVQFSTDMTSADPAALAPDARVPPGNPLLPFRIRGPGRSQRLLGAWEQR